MTQAASHDWRGVTGVGTAAFAWLAATAWARPLMLPDEGRYVGVAWEMLRSGDWLTPTLNGLPFFHKPPLFYWIAAGSLSLFGLHEEAARAAPLIGAWLGAMAMYCFVACWVGQRAARWTLAALLVQPLFYAGAQFANLDMLVAGCISATIALLAHATLRAEQQKAHRGALAGAYATAAAGVLAKGLIGFVIPGLVILVWLLILRRWRHVLKLLWPPGVLVFLLLAAPWFVVMQARFPGFLDYFFVVQQFKRYVAGGFNNVQPFWFFPVVLALLSLPWLPWLWGSVRRGLRGGKQIDWDNRGQGASVRLLCLVWLVVVVLFFSLPQSKLVGYILPAEPPLAFLIANGFLTIESPSRRTALLWWAGTAVSAAVGIGAVTALAISPRSSSREIAAALASARRDASQPVVMLDRYYYDLPYYAALRDPVSVVEKWDSPAIVKRDNWRKELADAAAFASPPDRGRLVTPDKLASRLCEARVSWIVAPISELPNYPFLGQATLLFQHRDSGLWRLDSKSPPLVTALDCRGIPIADRVDM